MRTAIGHWKQLNVPIDELDVDVDDNTRRVAELFEQLPSTVLHLGYGMGESVMVAADIAPERVRPLVDDLAEFRDDEILGGALTGRGHRQSNIAMHLPCSFMKSCNYARNPTPDTGTTSLRRCPPWPAGRDTCRSWPRA